VIEIGDRARVVVFDRNTMRVLSYKEDAPPEVYERRPDALVNPDMSAVRGVPSRDWIVEGGTVRAMTPAERDARAAVRTSDARLAVRRSARLLISQGVGVLVRAAVQALMEAVNFERAQRGVAQIHVDEIRARITEIIDSGEAD
jgi:hypothetical protein